MTIDQRNNNEEFVKRKNNQFSSFLLFAKSETDHYLSNQGLSDVEKRVLNQVKGILNGVDVVIVQSDLNAGILNRRTLDAVERMSVALFDASADNVAISPMVSVFFKVLFREWIKLRKEESIKELKGLGIKL